MTEKEPEVVGQDSSKTLTDDQIVTERGISRRSFLTAGGALLAGAVALASALPALAQNSTAVAGKKRQKPMAKKTVKKTTKTVAKKKTVKKPAKKEQRSDPDSHRR